MSLSKSMRAKMKWILSLKLRKEFGAIVIKKKKKKEKQLLTYKWP